MKEMISVTFTGGSKTAGETKRCAWARRSGQWRVRGGQVELWGMGGIGDGSVTARWGHTCECHITAAGVASADGAKFQFNTSNYRSLMGETTVTVARRRTEGGREEDGEPR